MRTIAAALMAAGVMPSGRAEPADPAGSAGPGGPVRLANPAAMADAEQHARQEIAAFEAGVATRVRHLVRWLAIPGGVLAGWLVVRRRRGG